MRGDHLEECKMRKVSLFSVVCILLMGGVVAHASLVSLSDYVSDGATPPSAEWLDATVSFSVAGTVLDVAVTNETGQGGDPAFNIAQIYFNAPDSLDDVGGLVLFDILGGGASALQQWQVDTLYNENGFIVNGFGKFDMRITDGGQHVIDPGETYTFRFNISGTDTYADTDFSTLLSELSPPEYGLPMLVAAKFVQGQQPRDASAFGATDVPEPATICLLGLGGLAFLRRKR